MSIRLAQPRAYADLGDIWLHDQCARLRQKGAQFGRHYRIDADGLLARLAKAARSAKAAPPAMAKALMGDHIRRAATDAAQHGASLSDHLSHATVARRV